MTFIDRCQHLDRHQIVQRRYLAMERGVGATRPGASEGYAPYCTLFRRDEATEYYKTPRGQKPNGATSGLFSFNSAAMGWDAFLHAEVLLTQPVMIVIGDKPSGFGAYRDGWEIYGRAASKDKHIVMAEGWSHYVLYDKPEPVALALARAVPFFKEHL